MDIITIKTKACMVCQKSSLLQLDYDAVQKFEAGAFVQDAFPDMSPADREMLITGTHPDCWDKIFPEDEE